MPTKSIIKLCCFVVILPCVVCVAEESEAKLHAQVKVLRNEVTTCKSHIIGLERRNAALTMLQAAANLESSKVAVAPAAEELGSATTKTERCTGRSAMEVLKGQDGRCTTGFSIGESGLGQDLMKLTVVGTKRQIAKIKKVILHKSKSGADPGASARCTTVLAGKPGLKQCTIGPWWTAGAKRLRAASTW